MMMRAVIRRAASNGSSPSVSARFYLIWYNLIGSIEMWQLYLYIFLSVIRKITAVFSCCCIFP